MVDWDGIVSREGPGVWRTLYRLLGNRADAEDCFQETFLNAVTLWRRERIEYPHAMLQRLATMRALDRLRKRYRRAKRETLFEEDFDFAANQPMPHQSAEAAELSDRMRAALSHLPEKQATAFCLFHLDGWDYQQIAGPSGRRHPMPSAYCCIAPGISFRNYWEPTKPPVPRRRMTFDERRPIQFESRPG